MWRMAIVQLLAESSVRAMDTYFFHCIVEILRALHSAYIYTLSIQTLK